MTQIIAVVVIVLRISHSHVLLTLSLAMEYGNQRFALKTAVAVRVRNYHRFSLKESLLFQVYISFKGIVTSPSFPDKYPENLRKTETIQVQSGQLLKVEFTHFDIQACGTGACWCDYVKVIDGDGTTLMNNSCGVSIPDPYSFFSSPHRSSAKVIQ